MISTALAPRARSTAFELLLGISGVGPKAALSILSSNTPDGLALAVLNGDEKALTTAPGIGQAHCAAYPA